MVREYGWMMEVGELRFKKILLVDRLCSLRASLSPEPNLIYSRTIRN